jgi:hypothetical protein
VTWEAGQRSGSRSQSGFMGAHTDCRPTAKDAIKRNLKEISTATRFGMFRAKKKLLRKAEL